MLIKHHTAREPVLPPLYIYI